MKISESKLRKIIRNLIIESGDQRMVIDLKRLKAGLPGAAKPMGPGATSYPSTIPVDKENCLFRKGSVKICHDKSNDGNYSDVGETFVLDIHHRFHDIVLESIYSFIENCGGEVIVTKKGHIQAEFPYNLNSPKAVCNKIGNKITAHM